MKLDYSAIIDVTPALAVIEDTSRLLLTVGVGLFLAYIVLLVGANMVGVIHRLVIQGRRTKNIQRQGKAPAHQAQVAGVARAMEREAA
ncbi:hypothetical protein GCM10023190_06990 [Enteractinococcus fodinae]|uniref:Uncharacterized protein n=1 Tax=Enteractinococcus fodinae TaxID=684663 RepID=A0ABU2B344_9MICC|nr:hypothetical protein [Enteractinococcus fodinae]MDR7346824.1 hypothetical protein [Enteractinococcus fodinae]